MKPQLKKFVGFEFLIYQADPMYRPEHLQLWIRFGGGKMHFYSIPVCAAKLYFNLARRNTIGGS